MIKNISILIFNIINNDNNKIKMIIIKKIWQWYINSINKHTSRKYKWQELTINPLSLSPLFEIWFLVSSKKIIIESCNITLTHS